MQTLSNRRQLTSGWGWSSSPMICVSIVFARTLAHSAFSLRSQRFARQRTAQFCSLLDLLGLAMSIRQSSSSFIRFSPSSISCRGGGGLVGVLFQKIQHSWVNLWHSEKESLRKINEMEHIRACSVLSSWNGHKYLSPNTWFFWEFLASMERQKQDIALVWSLISGSFNI